MGNRVSSMLQDEEIKLISEETGFSPPQIERLYSRFKSLDKSGICGSLSKEDFLRVPELAINPLCDRIVHMFFADCDENHDRINFRQFMKVLATFRSSTKPPTGMTNNRLGTRKDSIQSVLSPLTQNRYRHLRHSSCDGFFNYYPVQHHMTNQHSIYYVASTNNIFSQTNSYGSPITGGHIPDTNFPNHLGYLKRPYSNLIDPGEPANSRKQKLFFMFKIYDVDNDDKISLEDLKKILKIMVGNYIDESKLTNLANKTLNKADKNGNGFIDFDEFCTEFLHRDIDDALKVKFPNK